MSKPLRCAVIGLGIGTHHARSYQRIKGAELVALCDVNEARLEERGAEFDVPKFTDYKEMLSKAAPEVVSVVLPNHLHPPFVIELLDAGLHVVCEKPLANDLAGAEAIVEAAARAKGKLTVCYDKRYRADSQWLRRAMVQGTFGKIYHVEAGWKRETGIPGGWFSRKAAAGGGPLIDLGVHVLDIALWVLGFPAVKTVSGATRAVFGPAFRKTWGTKSGDGSAYEVEDGAVGMLRLDGDISLLLEASWADHRRPNEDDMYFRFAGDKAAAAVHIRNYTQEDTVRVYTEIDGVPVEARPDLLPPNPNGHAGLIDAFIRAIREDTDPPAPAGQGLVTMRVLDAFYRSAALGREVVLEP
jgi:predicted dehydrogenase